MTIIDKLVSPYTHMSVCVYIRCFVYRVRRQGVCGAYSNIKIGCEARRSMAFHRKRRKFLFPFPYCFFFLSGDGKYFRSFFSWLAVGIQHSKCSFAVKNENGVMMGAKYDADKKNIRTGWEYTEYGYTYTKEAFVKLRKNWCNIDFWRYWRNKDCRWW